MHASNLLTPIGKTMEYHIVLFTGQEHVSTGYVLGGHALSTHTKGPSSQLAACGRVYADCGRR